MACYQCHPRDEMIAARSSASAPVECSVAGSGAVVSDPARIVAWEVRSSGWGCEGLGAAGIVQCPEEVLVAGQAV